MEEQPDNKTEGAAPEALKLDFLHRREPEEEGAKRSRKALLWGGLILALLLMFAGTAVTTMAPKPWKPVGLYLFMAAALLYIICRCMTLGVLNTVPKVFSMLLLLAGCLILSKWPAPSPMGILGIACLAGALALILVGGLGYVRKSRRRGD
ncbi:MAG: hypothetical protein FJ290_03475 [Planctomycetes bacterium]|nr:hypothetical protein [Planctomycetota bacterium]